MIHIGVVNLSDRPYEPVLMHLPPYLQTKVEPNVLQKGEKGVITLTLNSERLTGLGLTQTSVYLSRFSGDKVGDENEIPVSAILLPDFSGMTEVEKANAPAISLSTKDKKMPRCFVMHRTAGQYHLWGGNVLRRGASAQALPAQPNSSIFSLHLSTMA